VPAAATEETKKGPKAYDMFSHDHELKYDLCVSAHDAQSGRVSSVYCRFCVSCGREVEESRKRRSTENRKFFQKPFRKDSYVSNLQGCHRQKWKEYNEIDSLCSERADDFFDTNARVAESMLAHLESRQPYTFHLSAAVVEGVICYTLLQGRKRVRTLPGLCQSSIASSMNLTLEKKHRPKPRNHTTSLS
jgi:hypothetical protein